MQNFIPDVIGFHLAPPPAWRLRELYEFDPSLVIIPSREQPYLIVAQRRPFNAKRIEPTLMRPDEAMLRAHGLIFVTNLVSVTGGWNWSAPSSDLRPHLAMRAPHRLGGFEHVDRALNNQDEAERMARRRSREQDWIIPGLRSAHRAYVSRTGGFVDLAKNPAARPTPRASLASIPSAPVGPHGA